MKNWYGCIGFLSLLGVWGALTEEPLFYPFFAFLVFFEYFWVTPDEMFLNTMKTCAATAFFCCLFLTAAAALAFSYLRCSGNPLAAGASLGFGVSIAVFAFSTWVAEAKERIWGRND